MAYLEPFPLPLFPLLGYPYVTHVEVSDGKVKVYGTPVQDTPGSYLNESKPIQSTYNSQDISEARLIKKETKSRLPSYRTSIFLLVGPEGTYEDWVVSLPVRKYSVLKIIIILYHVPSKG